MTMKAKPCADLMPDNLHPNEAGYQLWLDAVKPRLDEMMK